MAWSWFDHKSQDARDTSAEWTGFLDQGVKLEGKLESSGTLRVDSTVKGTLVCQETLILGERAVVEGEIDGKNVIIEGRFDGTIRAAKRAEIRPRAIVTGDIYAPTVVIEPGAIFEGQCHLNRAEDSPCIVIPIRSAATQT